MLRDEFREWIRYHLELFPSWREAMGENEQARERLKKWFTWFSQIRLEVAKEASDWLHANNPEIPPKDQIEKIHKISMDLESKSLARREADKHSESVDEPKPTYPNTPAGSSQRKIDEVCAELWESLPESDREEIEAKWSGDDCGFPTPKLTRRNCLIYVGQKHQIFNPEELESLRQATGMSDWYKPSF